MKMVLFPPQMISRKVCMLSFPGSTRGFRVNLDGRERTIHVERVGGTLTEVASMVEQLSLMDVGPRPCCSKKQSEAHRTLRTAPRSLCPCRIPGLRRVRHGPEGCRSWNAEIDATGHYTTRVIIVTA